MARYVVMGVEEYALKLSQLAEKSNKISKKALYAAAAVITDRIRSNIEALPVVPDYVLGTKDKPIEGVTAAQKAGLLDGLGFSPTMQDKKGIINVQIGYEGYNSVKTRKYPKGQPNLLIARSVESGTTFRKKTPFVRPAVEDTKSAAIAALNKVIDDEYERIMED